MHRTRDWAMGHTLMKGREQDLFHSVDWLSMEVEAEIAKPKVVTAIVYILSVFSCIELLMVVGRSFSKTNNLLYSNLSLLVPFPNRAAALLT